MELKLVLEAILFSAQQPLSAKQLKELLAEAASLSDEPAVKGLKKTSVDAVTEALQELEKDHAGAQRSYRLVCVAGSWQFASEPEYAPWIRALVGHKNRPPRLSQPALETLAIIAYRQPLTRAEMEQVRGVSVDGVMQTLMERGLVEQVGRAEAPGRPVTYGTTSLFLEYFGLQSLEALPAADELRRIPIHKPETLLTAEPGLATVPPEQLTLVESGAAGPAGESPAPSETVPPGALPPAASTSESQSRAKAP
jgi:segregation and condensation protein B